MHFYHCPRCGEKLIEKEIGDEGLLPYCNSCEIPYWDVFSSSIICAVINEENEIALLRQNYVSTTNYVCVAGMIKKGETCEETVCREVQEELGLTVTDMSFIRSYYYEKKELLMNGYLVKVKKKDFSLSGEVDNAAWFPIENAPSLLREGGIAWKLVTEILNQLSCIKSKKDINVRSTAKAIIINNDKILLNKCFDKYNGHYYSLPGGGQEKYESIKDAVIRECKEETGYDVIPIRFCGICEEICDNEDTQMNYSEYAHKLYHIYLCQLGSEDAEAPTIIDDMQEASQWIDVSKLKELCILPSMIGENITDLINNVTPLDMGTIHIPYNHG